MITLESITQSANILTFPIEVLPETRSAFCFFAAGFYGRNDVIHLYNYIGPTAKVTLVDNDEEKLEEMSRLYPKEWTYSLGDAYAVARGLASRGEKADLVVVDPWSQETGRALLELPLWTSLARKFLVIGVCKPWFEGKHLPEDVLGVNEWVKASHWAPNAVPGPATRLVKRSDYRGGVWWVVFEIGRS